MVHTQTGNKGVGLIEVLVALVVLSIGLLGLAALQVTGLRSNSSAGFRSAASMLANDIADRIRTNPTAAPFANFDSSTINCTTALAKQCSDYYVNGSTGSILAPNQCTSAEMATYDLNVWYCGVENNSQRVGGFATASVNSVLPGASATIVSSTNPFAVGSTYTITVNWTEANPNVDSTQTSQTAPIAQTLTLVITP